MTPIKVADGQWNEGDKLYFYNPVGYFGLSVIAEFVPVDTVMVEGYDAPDFCISGLYVVSSYMCYLNRANAVEHGKRNLMAELQDLDNEKERVQAKIDELERDDEAKMTIVVNGIVDRW